MKTFLFALSITLTLISNSEARDDTSVQSNIKWCLIDGAGEIQGRNTMRIAINDGDLGRAEFDFRRGFGACVGYDGTKTRNYAEWEAADSAGPLKYGRSLYGKYLRTHRR
ncbi:hypothetical protein [Bradyrhizobium lablabi]|uniref:hypothetical protein n=1 Tax=Bradyrhizobium lablabi TaxID=722472 RepID=UPI0012ABF13A|nr:hypothetical protein [Bradyrhizobium lablabi]